MSYFVLHVLWDLSLLRVIHSPLAHALKALLYTVM